ncbi:uncharacterized protein LOC110984519 isoform X2 [Acanthaster planci]|uniref:Uncharacterized protein LOC110984519 isoform X2 n=1 Tax=Acanthaster planci TaxID=133434 RepID=A0A8B7Z6R6_ACAPL|nr:uncharacterized protein LOC110984519 isoform X2 [Acanthaster planci]
MEEPGYNIIDESDLKYVVQNKEKLEIPKDCPEGWACLLRSCWNPDYKQRPTMEQVLETLVGLKRDSKSLILTVGDEDTLFVSPRKKVKSAERDDVKDSADVANKEIEEGYQRPGKQEERPLPFHCVADTTSVPPGDRILIAELNLSLYVRKGKMRPWHLKVWRHHVFESIPLPTQTGGYFFKGKLRDESGVPIYFICFERTFEKCRDRFDMITNSGKDRPLYMQYVTVLEQDEGYGGPENGESEYKLKIDEHSEIWWA